MIHGFGERLQHLRNIRNLSQKEVANALGISPSVLSNYESSERTPSLENLIALANFYHCSTDYLVGLEKHNPSATLDVSWLTEEQRQLLRAFLNTLK